MGFDAIHSFRHPLGVLERIPSEYGGEGLLSNYVAQRGCRKFHITIHYNEESC